MLIAVNNLGKRAVDTILIHYTDGTMWSFGNDRNDQKDQIINLTVDEYIVCLKSLSFNIYVAWKILK